MTVTREQANQRFQNMLKEIKERVEGIKGRRDAQKIAEGIMEKYGLKASKAHRDSYTVYWVGYHPEENTGAHTVFISYTGSKVKSVTQH